MQSVSVLVKPKRNKRRENKNILLTFIPKHFYHIWYILVGRSSTICMCVGFTTKILPSVVCWGFGKLRKGVKEFIRFRKVVVNFANSALLFSLIEIRFTFPWCSLMMLSSLIIFLFKFKNIIKKQMYTSNYIRLCSAWADLPSLFNKFDHVTQISTGQ